MKNKLFIILITFLSLVGVVLILYVTRFGAGISPDSIYYIAGCRNIFNEHAYLNIFGEPMTDWPPLFSFVLSILSYFFDNASDASRILNSIVFGANIFLVGIILWKVTKGSFYVSLFGVLLFITSIDMFLIHRMVWSEPLFILLIFTWVLLFNKYQINQNKLFLVLSALVGSLLFYQRYIGLFIFIVFVINIIFERKSISKKLKEASIYIFISALPIIGWMFRNNNVAGTSFNKHLNFYNITWADFDQLLNSISDWFINISGVPSIVKISIGLIFVCFMFYISIIFYKKYFRVNTESVQLIQLLFIIFLVYFLLLLVFRIVLNAQDAFQFRLMSPIYPICLVILVFYLKLGFDNIKKFKRSSLIKKTLLTLLSIFLLFQIVNTKNWITRQKDGYGYASDKWKNSRLLKIAKAIPEGKMIYSNLPIVVYYIANKYPNSIYKKNYSEIDFKNSIVILFDGISSRPLKYPEEDKKLTKFLIKNEGLIYCDKAESEYYYNLLLKINK